MLISALCISPRLDWQVYRIYGGYTHGFILFMVMACHNKIVTYSHVCTGFSRVHLYLEAYVSTGWSCAMRVHITWWPRLRLVLTLTNLIVEHRSREPWRYRACWCKLAGSYIVCSARRAPQFYSCNQVVLTYVVLSWWNLLSSNHVVLALVQFYHMSK